MRTHRSVLALTAAIVLPLTLAPGAARAEGDAPEISRSAGKEGGVVLFWPRIVPRGTTGATPLATALQARLKALVERAAPGRPIDVRPDPERVCPRDGCKSPTVGTLLVYKGTHCAVLGLFAAAGQSPTRIVPWVASVKLKAPSTPFREPPEAVVTISDWARCEDVVSNLAAGEAAIVEAIKTLLPAPAPTPTPPPAKP